VIRHPQQGLEQVEGLLRLAHEQVDPHELVLKVGPGVRILTHGQDLDGTLSLADRVHLPPQVGEREAQKDPLLGVVRRRAEQLLQRDPGRVGIRVRQLPVVSEPVGLGEHNAPGPPVVVEGARRKAQQEPLLRVIQQPVQVPVVGKEGD
jgi:hypothetical protein